MQLEPVKSAQNVCSKPILRHVNPHIVCGLCEGYLIDATTVIHCLHSYCHSCLLRYLRSSKSKVCPTCRDQLNASQITRFRRDRTLQRLVYKLVPGLFRDEISRRNSFNKTMADVETNMQSRPDNSEVALKLHHRRRKQQGIEMTSEVYTGDEHLNVCLLHCDSFDELGTTSDRSDNAEDKLPVPAGDRRYLQCPVGFTVGHLKKYLHYKFGIENKFEVDMFIGKQSVDDCLTLVDVAYCFYGKKVPDVTLKYVVSSVRPSTTPTNCSPPLTSQEHNPPPTVVEPTAAVVDRTKPKTTTTNRFRTPTSRIRKRMLNDTRLRSTATSTLPECPRIPNPPTLIVWSAGDGVGRPLNSDELVQVPLRTFESIGDDEAEENHRRSLDETQTSSVQSRVSASVAAMSDKWLSTGTETFDDDVEMFEEMSEDGSSDIDGEIRKLAAGVTRSNRDDDVASVFSDEVRNCNSPMLAVPCRAEFLEPRANSFAMDVGQSSRLVEIQATEAALSARSIGIASGKRAKVTFNLVNSTHDSSLTPSGNREVLSPGVSFTSVSPAEQRSNVFRTCSVTSPSITGTSASAISVLLSSAFLSSTPPSTPFAASNNTVAHSTKSPVVSCPVDALPIDASSIQQSSVVAKDCSVTPDKSPAGIPELPIGSKSASLENLVSSSTDSVASTSPDQLTTSDLVHQQKQLTETLLLSKETLMEVTSEVRAIELAQSSSSVAPPGSTKSIGCTTKNAASGVIRVSSEQLLVIKRGSLPGFITRTENSKSVGAESSGSVIAASKPPVSTSPMSGSEPATNSSTVGTQTQTDLLGRYFKRRMNPISSFLPGCNGRLLRSAATVCGNAAGQGLKDRMARPGVKTAPVVTTASNRSTTSGSTSTVYFASGPQGTPLIVPVSAMTSMNLNNKGGTFLIALPANFTLQSSSSATTGTSLSVPSVGVAKTVSTAVAGSLTVRPTLVNATSQASNRTAAVVLNRTPSGPPLQVIVAPSHVGMTSSASIKSIHSTVVGGGLSGGLNRAAVPGPRLAKMQGAAGSSLRPSGEHLVEKGLRTANLPTVRTPVSQPQTIIYYSRPMEVVNPGQKKNFQAPQFSSAVSANRGTVSSFNKVVKHPMVRPPVTRVTSAVPMTSSGGQVTKSPGGARNTGPSSVTQETSTRPLSSDSSSPSVPGVAAVGARGQRMEGAPVSFIRAILERSIASPEAYGSLSMVDDRSSVSPDHVTSSGGVVEAGVERQESGSGFVHQGTDDLSGDDVVFMSSSAGHSQSTKRPQPDSAADNQFSPTAAKRPCLDQPGKTPIAGQQNVTMEMILAKYCKQQNTSWPTSVGSSLSNGSGDVTVPFASSSRITRSGMVALPKKIYAYLGSAMSHEHIANQLVPGSPSPPTNNGGVSTDSSDGLVPASPTSSATSGRHSIESMTTSDDGPIRNLRLLCNGLRNAVQ